MSEPIEFEPGWVMDAHGSIMHVGDRTPPLKRRDIMRGSFAIVEHATAETSEIRLVLLDQGDLATARPNLKLVYTLELSGGGVLVGREVERSPGLGRERA